MMGFRQFKAIVGNTVRVTVSDPFFLVLHLALLLFMILLGALPGFTYGEHTRLLRDQAQALLFIAGCLGIVFSCVRVFSLDIQRGTGAILQSRPVSPLCLIGGKWAGIIASVALLEVSGAAAYLWVSEISHKALFLNHFSLALFFGALLLALAAGGIRHYLFGGVYPVAANMILCVVMLGFTGMRVLFSGPAAFDWAGLSCSLMIGFALIAFSAFVLPLAVALNTAAVLGGGGVIFFFGLISEHLLRQTLPWASIQRLGRAILPNWQVYWIADRLNESSGMLGRYIFSCGLQSLLLALTFVFIGALIYSRTEIRGLAS